MAIINVLTYLSLDSRLVDVLLLETIYTVQQSFALHIQNNKKSSQDISSDIYQLKT